MHKDKDPNQKQGRKSTKHKCQRRLNADGKTPNNRRRPQSQSKDVDGTGSQNSANSKSIMSTGSGRRQFDKKKKKDRNTDRCERGQRRAYSNGGRGREKGRGRGKGGVGNGGGGGGGGNDVTGGCSRGSADRRGAKNKGNTKFYDAYMNDEDISAGIKSGTIVKGTLRINSANRNEAYVTVEHYEKDIFIDGDKLRNRALHGDVVAVQLAPRESWAMVKHATVSDVYDTTEMSAEEKHHSRILWQPLKLKAVSEETIERKNTKHSSTVLNAQGTDSHIRPPNHSASTPGMIAQPAGRVVGIMEKSSHPDLIGSLQVPRGIQKGKGLPKHYSFVLFSPRDRRYPFMMISRQSLPKNYTEDPCGEAGKQLFRVSITEWNESSRFPQALLHECVGNVGNIEVETASLLKLHDVDHGDFPLEVLRSVEEYTDEWVPPAEEIARRKDLRALRIFSIDPTTAKDLDDALSIEWDEAKQLYRVGVHIADVTYFVRPGTPLDDEARRRATTVYLVQLANPMLPPILCERLCSLNPKVDRLAFSCFWYMTKEGNLHAGEPVWYGKSVIHTCCQLDYRTAQDMLDELIRIDPTTGDCLGVDLWEEHRRPTGGHKMGDIINDVKLLNRIAQRRRRLRMQAGAFKITTKQLTFKLDQETKMPRTAGAYIIRQANQLVEEYMLLANNLVAKELVVYVGELAFLRKHDHPDPTKLNEFCQWCKAMGFITAESSFDVGSDRHSGTLQESIERLKSGLSAEDAELVEFKLVNAMQPAQYFTIASSLNPRSWRHYALAMDYYTHFTSPIRRYADIIVHRLLQAILERRGRDASSDNMRLSREEQEIEPLAAGDVFKEVPPSELVGTVDASHAGEEPLCFSIETLAGQAKICNDKKKKAHDAGVASSKLFLWLFVKAQEQNGRPLVLDGIVVNDGVKFATVYLPEYGFTLPLYYDQHEIQLGAKILCKEINHMSLERNSSSIRSNEPIDNRGRESDAVGRRAQFAANSADHQTDSEKGDQQVSHVVTMSDGVEVEVTSMGHVRVAIRINPAIVGEFSILLSY